MEVALLAAVPTRLEVGRLEGFAEQSESRVEFEDAQNLMLFDEMSQITGEMERLRRHMRLARAN